MKVKLEQWEMQLGAMAAIQRQTENLLLGRRPAHGAGTKNDWQISVEGCLGEMAVAKALGMYWSGKGIFRGGDVGDYQVRTAGQDHYRLILHPEDPDDAIFFLVTGRNGEYIIKGWIRGVDGKRDEYWADPVGGRAAYFIPQTALTSLPENVAAA